ncbi:MAG: efflux RND transporter periplasmic adaptor subunit [Hyphomonadaceae bacterium]|nr:efflux RND transporter periplasmic adaptor subunit [Hyphomonadaceae bacterium]
MLTRPQQKVQELWSRRPALLRGRNLYLVVGGGLLILLLAWLFLRGDSNTEPYRSAAVDRGAITRVVSATGTLQPLVSANVGSTVSGPVTQVLVDFNSQVRANQVLARLDPTPFQQRIVQAQAQLAQAQAQAAVANADYERYVALQQRGFASEQLMAQQRAARDTARAAVAQAQAALASARTDLDRSVIRSPIDGVVVDRQVNVGQSVAASFQAPTLFVIAQDLSRLQANITVDEADIGEVEEGMPVRFTVDAFPDRQFEGRVSQVRQQGVAEQGVVSYTVVVQADNPGRQLLPGMTANAEIVIEERDNVLRVPNTALRFRPGDPQLAAQAQAMTQEGGAGAQAQGQAAGGGQGARGASQLTQALELNEQQQQTARQAFQSAMASAQSGNGGNRRTLMRQVREQVIRELEPTLNAHQRELLAQMRASAGQRREVRQDAVLWVLRNNRPAPVQVVIGIADSSYTLIHSGLAEGDQVIVGGGPQAPQQQNGPLGGSRGGAGGVRIRGA